MVMININLIINKFWKLDPLFPVHPSQATGIDCLCVNTAIMYIATFLNNIDELALNWPNSDFSRKLCVTVSQVTTWNWDTTVPS